MKPILILAALVAVPLGGCSSVFGDTASPNFQAFLADIRTCDRDYSVTFGASTAPLNGSAQVHCKAQVAPASAAPAN
jgi:hypothetical protein